ncbi:response regulator transcription factor [Dyadobacter koreensis]|nr:response regulator transcription factor [Dyadobacter koreensis]
MISRLGLSILLNNYYQDVMLLEANNVQEYNILFGHHTPDMIILGNNSNDEEKCLAVARQLKKLNPDLPLIIYDEHLMRNLTISYFRIGISGYILRQNTAEEMIPCIETILNQKKYLSPILTEHLLDSLSHNYGEKTPKRRPILTRREIEIASYIAQGMKTSQISAMLGRKASTVSSIKHNIFRKLNVKSVTELLDAFSEFPF